MRWLAGGGDPLSSPLAEVEVEDGVLYLVLADGSVLLADLATPLAPGRIGP